MDILSVISVKVVEKYKYRVQGGLVRTLKNTLLRKFLRSTLIPVIIIELLLVASLFAISTYQAMQNKKVLTNLAQSTFNEIAQQVSARLSFIFSQSKNNIEQIRSQAQEIFTNPNRYKNSDLKLFYREGFYQNSIGENLSSVYTTNIEKLSEQDNLTMQHLSLLVPTVEQVVKNNKDLIYSSWINIDSRYSLFFPYVNTVNELSPTLDVTTQRFYYEADEKHNPNRVSRFIALYNEPWAITFGQLGTFLAPIYVKKKFIGVIGLTLSIKDSANILKNVKLPFNGYVSLVDSKNKLLISSDDKRLVNESGAHTFYWMFVNKVFKSLEKFIPSDEYKKSNAVYEKKIDGTNLRLLFSAKKSDINADVNNIYKKAKQIGYAIITFILLFYAIFILFIIRKIKNIASSISEPVEKMVEFSKKIGRGIDLKLEDTEIYEISTLNNNLFNTHKKLTQMLIKDDVTDLYNRRKLLMDIKPELDQTLMILNLGSLKSINTIYGAEAGDKALRRIAKSLSSCKIEGNRLYRIGSSDFAVLASGMGDPTENASQLESLLLEISQTSIDYTGIDIALSASAGVAFSANNDKNELTLLARADIALSQAKAHHRGGFVLFNDNLVNRTDYRKNLEWGRKVKDAIEEHRLIAYFQPIYDISQDKIYKFEALVRMIDNDKVISPFFFLEAAKQIGKLHEITRIMIVQVFRVASEYPKVEFSINTSFEDFEHAEIMPFIAEQLEKYKINPSNIIFEILETGNVSDENIASDFIEELQEIGFKIAIDDFGTGNSNFAHLLMMNPDYIKIDGQFIKDIATNKNSQLISRTISDFARLTKAKTIAEYVATKEILDIVEDIDIDFAQGYYISEPKPKEEISEMLLTSRL